MNFQHYMKPFSLLVSPLNHAIVFLCQFATKAHFILYFFSLQHSIIFFYLTFHVVDLFSKSAQC